ncbi:uncharacterized protein EDB91DRAFT_1254223 [Suillus paluster]|uniref:uncharacterized protein n=1 Tax=Suillus paluster TaxID=48578 RepID=UPI001B881856|nr:uncharacterized protein EDB91DRAFT_1254223 [Suillus paluster]KAG1726721.1 hypothetical protein EDB91DRAFT_1254223 [Suillus paluster]
MSLEAEMAIMSLREFEGLLDTKDFGLRRAISSLHALATILLPDPTPIIMLDRLAYSEALNQLQAGNSSSINGIHIKYIDDISLSARARIS